MIDSKTAQAIRSLAEKTSAEEFKMLLLQQIGPTTTEKGNEATSVSSLEEKDTSQKIAAIFREVGIPAHVKGYNYLMQAIIYCLGKGSDRFSMTKELYPTVAKKFDTTPSRIERGIRHAIEICYSRRGNGEELKKYLGTHYNASTGKLSNSEFIYGLANWIKLYT